MKLRFNLLIAIIFACIAFSNAYALESKKLDMFDESRGRNIPVVVYQGETTNKPVVIISHGYGAKNTEYSFIANSLAANGYFVATIQHDLETDKPLPTTGNLFDRRKPLWERGVQNILFVIKELKKTNQNLNLDKVILIGHSNGGDISMMFTDRYTEKVNKVISLDSLRYPFPSDKGVPILHFGANDTKADPGVIPGKGVKTILIESAKHIDLCDRGGQNINEEILKSITQFLK